MFHALAIFFNQFVVHPILNLLIFVYAILPGHNFGLALILFTIIIRLLLWPLVKKQLHQTKAMRKLQPEITKIKKATKGNRQKESLMLMELYKERGINPLGTFPTLIVQLVVLIGLYSGLQKVIKNPHTLVSSAYPVLQQHLGWLTQLSHNIKQFDNTLFGLIDLNRPAFGPHGFYLGAFLLVAGSAFAQFYQAKQLLPAAKDKRSLRSILKDAGAGKAADQSEVNAAVSQKTIYILPAVVFLFTVNLPAALSLYWLAGGIVAFIQQSIVLNKDEKEMETMGGKPSRDVAAIPEAEVVSELPVAVKPVKNVKHKKGNKRRKK
ncbi:MAG: YidC/Oxa1 family membrane protein insertase [Patescibacteria group bacterium]|nr:YidC/Oxa1 family membrane protein insertase [Patescibacteria group bacterium]